LPVSIPGRCLLSAYGEWLNGDIVCISQNDPDQLSFLIHGAEYHNADIDNHPVMVAFGSGCGQLAAVLGNVDAAVPRAVIGATDMAMREHLPPDILAFTVNGTMYEQLCRLDEHSFMHKQFWKRLMKTRKGVKGKG
jgi:hypothetical protein